MSLLPRLSLAFLSMNWFDNSAHTHFNQKQSPTKHREQGGFTYKVALFTATALFGGANRKNMTLTLRNLG